MNRIELNKLIGEEHKYPVYVGELEYNEVEEMYLDTELTKSQIGTFYQKWDYQGIRNALTLIHGMKKFKLQVIDNIIVGKQTHISTSQKDVLELMGWNISKLNIIANCPWVK